MRATYFARHVGESDWHIQVIKATSVDGGASAESVHLDFVGPFGSSRSDSVANFGFASEVASALNRI